MKTNANATNSRKVSLIGIATAAVLAGCATGLNKKPEALKTEQKQEAQQAPQVDYVTVMSKHMIGEAAPVNTDAVAALDTTDVVKFGRESMDSAEVPKMAKVFSLKTALDVVAVQSGSCEQKAKEYSGILQSTIDEQFKKDSKELADKGRDQFVSVALNYVIASGKKFDIKTDATGSQFVVDLFAGGDAIEGTAVLNYEAKEGKVKTAKGTLSFVRDGQAQLSGLESVVQNLHAGNRSFVFATDGAKDLKDYAGKRLVALSGNEVRIADSEMGKTLASAINGVYKGANVQPGQTVRFGKVKIMHGEGETSPYDAAVATSQSLDAIQLPNGAWVIGKKDVREDAVVTYRRENMLKKRDYAQMKADSKAGRDTAKIYQLVQDIASGDEGDKIQVYLGAAVIDKTNPGRAFVWGLTQKGDVGAHASLKALYNAVKDDNSTTDEKLVLDVLSGLQSERRYATMVNPNALENIGYRALPTTAIDALFDNEAVKDNAGKPMSPFVPDGVKKINVIEYVGQAVGGN